MTEPVFCIGCEESPVLPVIVEHVPRCPVCGTDARRCPPAEPWNARPIRFGSDGEMVR